MSSSWHGGKGDSSRTKNNVKYGNNWDSIFRTNQIIEGLEPAEVYEERKERYERVMAPHRSKDTEPTVKKKKTVFDKSKMKYSDGDNT